MIYKLHSLSYTKYIDLYIYIEWLSAAPRSRSECLTSMRRIRTQPMLAKSYVYSICVCVCICIVLALLKQTLENALKTISKIRMLRVLSPSSHAPSLWSLFFEISYPLTETPFSHDSKFSVYMWPIIFTLVYNNYVHI